MVRQMTESRLEELKKLLSLFWDDWNYPIEVRDHAADLLASIRKAQRERQDRDGKECSY